MKDEALFLADELEAPVGTVISSEVDRRAAAELRRLHAENALLHERHHFDNGVLKELLETLKAAVVRAELRREGAVDLEVICAAITKAEGEKT